MWIVNNKTNNEIIAALKGFRTVKKASFAFRNRVE